jgi:AcrR family transcriptional regulator
MPEPANSIRKRAARLLTTKRDRTRPRPMPATRKGKMRRQLLKEATAELLEETSYHDLTLDQITKKAGIPLSVFYHYFNSKKEITQELLEELFADFEERMSAGRPYGTWERGVRKAHEEMIELHRRNIGLMRCLTEVEEPEFAQRWRAKLNSWRIRLVDGLSEFADPGFADRTELFAIITALDGMTHAFIYELIVLENPKLKKFLRKPDDAVEFLTALWLRAIFLEPPQDKKGDRFPTLAHLRERDTRARS